MTESTEATLAALTQSGTDPAQRGASHGHALRSGLVVGRFTVQERLGAGGMGIVHAAHDPRLGRRVAIKVMHASDASPAGRRAQRRLQREARAMAILSHPNVIAVHDVGVHEGHVFVAMELVQGRSLRAWCKDSRPWNAVLDVSIQAGQGLLAAHRAGVVHRDFKPDNVLVADNGRVLVGDFGLAAVLTPTEGATPLAESDPDEGTVHDGGTPGYMAPEQLARAAISPAVDQFAFAVTTWEALYGQKPFAGVNAAELAASVLGGRVQSPPRGPVPRDIRAVLERALAVDARHRWPDMSAMLDALKAARVAPRRRRRVLAFSGIIAIAIAVAAWPTSRCDEARSRAAEAWSTARHQAVLSAYAPAPGSGAHEHLERTSAVLDDWLAGWTSAHDAACRSAPTQDDARLSCLRASVGALEQLVEHLARARMSPAEALSGALALPSAQACAIASSEAEDPVDPAIRGREDWLRELKARAEVLSAAGDARDAATLLQTGHDAALALGPRDAALHLRLALAQARHELGESDAAGEAMEAIYWEAVAAGRDALAARASAAVLQARSATLAFSDVDTWVQYAESAARRVDAGDGMPTATYLHCLGVLRAAQRREDEARDAFQAGLQIVERLDPGDRRVLQTRQNVAAMLLLTGHRQEGIPILREVIAEVEAQLGARHPELAAPLTNLAMALQQEGNTHEAMTLVQRATEITEETFGAQSVAAAEQQEMRGLILREAERHEESLAAFDAARRGKEAGLGAEHPTVASARFGMGEANSSLGRLDAARRDYEAVVELLDGRDGHEHLLAGALNNLAFVLLQLEQPERAEPVLLRALELADARGDVAAGTIPAANLAQRRVEQGRPADAVPFFERALPRIEELVPAEPAADVHLAFADALWESGGDRARALELAQEALELAGEDSGVGTRARTWLAEHPGG